MRTTRRQFLTSCAAGMALGLMPFGRMALANARTEKRLIVIILRGAMDGLAAVIPHGDAQYKAARGAMALGDDALLNLDGFFAFHSALKPLHQMYQNKELLVVHAIASGYRERSHFDAQDMLENGGGAPHAYKDGWLNRAMAQLPAAQAIAVGTSIPLVIRGERAVSSWSPSVLNAPGDDFMLRLRRMYDADPSLQAILAENDTLNDIAMQGGGGRQNFGTLAKAAAQFLKEPNGPRIATLEMGGWDTHSNQGGKDGRLANYFTELADGIVSIKTELGSIWQNTAIIIMTEFGRTVAANGTGGTDHGTASVAFLAGGAVQGGKIMTQWPGLGASQLYQSRDLMPTAHLQSLLKGVLQSHWGIAANDLNNRVFPGSASVPIWGGLTA